MNNGWLQFLIPKEHAHVESLAEVTQLRNEKVRIYGVRKAEDGYIITVRRGTVAQAPIVGRYSIYSGLAKFVIPVAFVWAMLLVTLQFITIDYEVRGNLIHEDVQRVSALIEPHFINVGPFAFFRSDNDVLVADIATLFHDYIWIDVKAVGSRLMIDIFDTQTTDPFMPKEQIDTIYARASGVVTGVDATGCRVLVEIDQVVRLGDALITCYTPTGFSGTETAPIEGVATGSVYAHVWYEVAIEFPREYAVRMVTSSSHSNLFLTFGNRRLRVWGQHVEFEDFDERHRIFNPLAIFNIAPITLERVHYYEKSDIILTNETEIIRKRADDLVEAQLSELVASEFELIELQLLTLEETDGMVRMTYHATVQEDIAAGGER